MFQPLQTNNTIIICHGVTENKINSVKYARLLKDLAIILLYLTTVAMVNLEARQQAMATMRKTTLMPW